MTLRSKRPTWDQNLQCTPLGETTSITVIFVREYPRGKRSIAKRMKRKIPYLKFSSDLISHGVFVVVVVVLFLAFLELNSFIFVILAITLVEE